MPSLMSVSLPIRLIFFLWALRRTTLDLVQANLADF
jgi:hypothetical protein